MNRRTLLASLSALCIPTNILGKSIDVTEWPNISGKFSTISRSSQGSLWFFNPKSAAKSNGPSWQNNDPEKVASWLKETWDSIQEYPGNYQNQQYFLVNGDKQIEITKQQMIQFFNL